MGKTSKGNDEMEWLTLFIYILIIFFNIFFDKFIPYANYTDELICLLFMTIAIVYICKDKGKVAVNKEQKNSILCILLVLFIGIVGNVMYGYMPSVSVIGRDIIGTFKFFIIYLVGRRIIVKNNIRLNSKKIISTAKIIITVIFVFGIVNLLVNTGIADEVRYGLRSYKFIYSHYTYLVYNEVLLYSILATEDKRNAVFKIMSLLSIAATFRTKGFITIAFILAYYLLNFAKKKRISFKDIFKPVYIAPIGIVCFFISKSKIQQYLSWGASQSIRVGVHSVGLKIANDHLPFGTGFGTFGTNISYKNQSQLYNIYNSLNYSHLMNYGYATMSDVYWPSIYVQFGYIGMIVYVILIIQICKDLLNNAMLNNRCKFSILLILFYMVSASLSEATFSNESGAFSAVVILIIVAISRKNALIKCDCKDNEGINCG